jgi:hypothetical protein
MRTEWLCQQLNQLEVSYFREPYMNIVTIHSKYISQSLVDKYDLVPQKHGKENHWYKIVVMDHVEVDHFSSFITDLEASLKLTLNFI